MVQALREIIELDGYNEVSLKKTLSLFRCVNPESDAAKDVMHFLAEDAVIMEKSGTTRTYLVLNDSLWKEGKIQIDGYFSIALKVLYFAKDLDETVKQQVVEDMGRQNCPAYLIGQLARSQETEKGSGKRILQTALEYIAEASNIVGGRIVYLDCSKEKESYYSDHGFHLLQKKHKSDLIQMYRVI